MSRFRKHLRPEYRWCTKELNRVSDHLRRVAAEADILDSATDVGREDRAHDRSAHVTHQDGSHQKWRLWNGTSIIVPVHSRDIPVGTLRSIERQGASALGRRWLTETKRDG